MREMQLDALICSFHAIHAPLIFSIVQAFLPEEYCAWRDTQTYQRFVPSIFDAV